MSLSLAQTLETSAALSERIASAASATEQQGLLRKKAMVDFAAFGLFKQAADPFLSTLAKPLAWGLGLGLPALGVGHLLARAARYQAEEVIDHARNQALLAALGIRGAQTAGNLIKGMRTPKTREETHELTFPDTSQMFGRNVIKISHDSALHKLAAVLCLDDVLEVQLSKSAGEARTTVEECLFLNRMRGTELLRQLVR